MERLEIAALPGDQAVDHPNAMAAPKEFLGQMRANKARAAGNEIRRQVASRQFAGKPALGIPGVIRMAFW